MYVREAEGGIIVGNRAAVLFGSELEGDKEGLRNVSSPIDTTRKALVYLVDYDRSMCPELIQCWPCFV